MNKDVLEYMNKVKDYYLGKSDMSTKEAVNILLDSNKTFNDNEKSIYASSSYNSYEFDMDELLRWKNKSNDKYEITSHWAITSHRKLIGRFIILSKKVVRKLLKWYVSPIVEQQNEFNGAVTASINALYNNELATQAFIRHSKNKDYLLEEKLNELEEKLNESQEKLNKSEEINNELRAENKMLLNKLDNINFKLSKINKTKIQENNSISKVGEVSNQIQESKNTETITLNEYSLDYFEFENKFRGIRSDIKNNQAIYVKYFKDKENILDIGCGRGEFLELLGENNIKAKGIDVYEEFVQYCKYKRMDVTFEDGVSYLSKIKDNSLGGVFMSQVAEHVETEYLIELISKVYNKLEEGAYFIAETPNPTMLSTFSNSFYLDPSHKNPVHPETFKFILEKSGFKDIEIIFTESSKIQYHLPLLNGSNINNLEEFNNGMNLLSDLLFGSQDYAIIARK